MKNIFCANCQKITAQTGTVDGNGEFLFTCPCGRFIKFPTDTTTEGLTELLITQESDNIGQVSILPQLDVLAEVIAAPDLPPAETVAETPTADSTDIPAESQPDDPNNVPA